ncbi:MAG: protein-L-isoaspartate(D-aspartate) O-methyltransferase [Candidatus Schekmanbacteria bacterium]|nr:protein-L-isoaspartate(D-aspartate) O-methyltransferase [Candidatus Schekmanbacteria bacterium]
MRSVAPLLLLAAVAAAIVADAADDGEYAARRRAMIAEIKVDVVATAEMLKRESLDARVWAALERVPRHEFVPPEEQAVAYENRPVSIGHGQTISQPYIVAIMTDLLNLRAGARVLEVGTGSGYQAAVLAELGCRVFSIEIIEPLHAEARERLSRLGFDGIRLRHGDGYYGWKEEAPFDGILVTAAAGQIPPPLLVQLAPGGRMIIPVGSSFFVQDLVIVDKTKTGELRTRQVLPVSFVPLTGAH